MLLLLHFCTHYARARSHELDMEIFRALVRNNFVVFQRYSGGVGGIRVATHLFNTEAEIDGVP